MAALVVLGVLVAAILADRYDLIDFDRLKNSDVVRGLAVMLRGVWGVAKWVAILILCCSGAGCIVGIPWMLYEVAKAERANWMSGDWS
jgi:hypothetical protein